MPILPSFPEQHCLMLYQGTAAIRQEFSNQTSTFISSVQFSHSVVSDSLRPHELQHTRHPCPSPAPGACSNSCPLSQPSYPLLSPSPPAFSISQHQSLFQGVSSSHQVVKVLELQLQHKSFQSIFRTDFL